MTVLMYIYAMKSYADHAFCMLHPLETYIMLTVYTKEFSSLILWITWVLVIFFFHKLSQLFTVRYDTELHCISV